MLSLQVSCTLSFPIVGFKLSSFLTFESILSTNKIFVVCKDSIYNVVFHKNCLLCHDICSQLVCAFRTVISHQRPLNIVLSLINSTLLSANMIIFCTKKLVLSDVHHSHFHTRIYNRRRVQHYYYPDILCSNYV